MYAPAVIASIGICCVFVPPAAPPPSTPPLPRTSLIGREVELATAHRLVLDDAAPLLTLTGPGGVGKTHLALAIAHDVAAGIADGVVWVDLASLANPHLVGQTIAAALALTPGDRRSTEHQLIAYLRPRQMLVLLDNCEHLLGAVAALAAHLLASCPTLQILATSRAPLRIRGEILLPVSALPIPGARDLASPAQVAENPAVQLFLERARAANSLDLADADTLTVADICCRLEGLPLALELAAAQVRVLPLATLRERLASRLPLLEDGTRDAPPRQHSIRQTIAWSYDLLPPVDQTLFRWLAVFAGGFTLEAVEHLVSATDDLPIDPLRGVTVLVDSGLVQPSSDPTGEPHYTMLETIREFGLEQLAVCQEEPFARAAHAAYYLAFAERAAPMLLGSGVPAAWLDRLAADHNNLRAALAWLSDGTTPEDFLRLAAACGWYWYRRGYVQEGRSWLQRALVHAAPTLTVAKGRGLYWAAALAIRAGDAVAARPLAQEAMAIWDHLGDPAGQALASYVMARCEKHQAHWEAAVPRFEEALAVWRTIDDAASIGLVVIELAEIAFAQGDLAQARAMMLEAAAYLRQADERTWLAAAELYLGLIAVAEGQFAEAARHYRACLAGYLATGDAFLQSPLAGLARVAAAVDLPEIAAQLLGVVDAELERTGMQFDRAEQVGRELAEAAARAALGHSAFVTASMAGRTHAREHWLVVADDIVAATEAAASSRHDPSREAALGLTPRERDVLRLVADGFSDRAVSEALFIGQGTVRSHLTSIFGKLDVGSRTAAVAAARRLGII